MADQNAFLSVRVPQDVRNRVKALAARNGQSVQDLVGQWVQQLLEQQDRQPPRLTDIIAALRACQADLRSRGVDGLWVFGSTARGDARPDSDVDLIVSFDPAAKVPLTAVARLREDLAQQVGRPVDLAEWRSLPPAVRAEAERDAVRVI